MVLGKGISISSNGQRQLQRQQTRVDRVGVGDDNGSSGRQRTQPTIVGREMGPPNDNERGVMSANYGLMMPFFWNQTKDVSQNERMVFVRAFISDIMAVLSLFWHQHGQYKPPDTVCRNVPGAPRY
jgi:hypothetical protein